MWLSLHQNEGKGGTETLLETMQMACWSTIPTTLHTPWFALDPAALLTISLPFPSAQCPYHKEVIEEEDLPLMQPQPLGAVWIWHLIELAAANQSTVRERQDRFLANNHALHSLHLGHMVIIGP